MPCGPLQAPAQGVAVPSMAVGGGQQRAPRSLKVFLSGAERGWRGLISWGTFTPLVASGTKLQERDSAMGAWVLNVGPLAPPARRETARVSMVTLRSLPAGQWHGPAPRAMGPGLVPPRGQSLGLHLCPGTKHVRVDPRGRVDTFLPDALLPRVLAWP